MLWFCAALSAAGVLESVICSCLVAELAGYWLHRLLHSDKLPFVSRSHMVHHLLLYGPMQPMRAGHHKDATRGRFSRGNAGLEWLAPSPVVLSLCWGLMFLIHVPAVYQVIVLGSLFVFNRWFRRARRLHDIHHHSVDGAGHMDTNFGIGFFLFDGIFRTLATSRRPVNRKGLEPALQPYQLTISFDSLRYENTAEGEAAFQ